MNTYLKANGRKPMSVGEIACGFIKVANEAMCRPIRNLTQVCVWNRYILFLY